MPPQYRPSTENADLLGWPDVIAELGDSPALLLGNGGSRAVWDGFSYESLFRTASQDVEHPLTDADLALFADLDGTDFERVLGAVQTARRVSRVIELSTIHLTERYVSIQRALSESVAAAHVSWDIASSRLAVLRTAYEHYGAIYTTNYDLLLYWAWMSGKVDPSEFVDFFRGTGVTFDPWQTGVPYASTTALYYLHGAIHLRRNAGGFTRKETAGGSRNLLAAFSIPASGDETPLIVTEGSFAQKEASIRSSDYLSFAFDTFAAESRPLVVFGHALGDEDSHISKAIRQGDARLVAVGIRGDPAHVRRRKRHYADRLGSARVVFFDSSTHPLGDPTLLLRAPAAR